MMIDALLTCSLASEIYFNTIIVYPIEFSRTACLACVVFCILYYMDLVIGLSYSFTAEPFLISLSDLQLLPTAVY